VLLGLAMMMIYCAASGSEDLGHQMFHVVCSSMMMMLVLGFIHHGLSRKGKAVFSVVSVGFANLTGGYGNFRGPHSFRTKSFRSTPAPKTPRNQANSNGMDTTKLAALLAAGAYDLPQDVIGSPGAAESEATEPVALEAMDPADADLATCADDERSDRPGAAESQAKEHAGFAPVDRTHADLDKCGVSTVDVGVCTSSYAVEAAAAYTEDPLGVLGGLIEASFSAAKGLGEAGGEVHVAAVAVSMAAVMTESRPLGDLAVGLPGLEPKAVVRVGASSVKTMVLTNMLGAASAQGGLLFNKVVR